MNGVPKIWLVDEWPTRQRLNGLIEQEWPELFYTMMRITAAAGSREKKRFYWRDHCVQRGDVELNPVRNPSEDGFSTYTAIYSAEDHSGRDFHRDLLVPLYPSLEGQQLRW